MTASVYPSLGRVTQRDEVADVTVVKWEGLLYLTSKWR